MEIAVRALFWRGFGDSVGRWVLVEGGDWFAKGVRERTRRGAEGGLGGVVGDG